MKTANFSQGLSVGPAPHYDIVDAHGVVVAQAPHGIHTQLKNTHWKRHARFFALAPTMVRMLQNMADQQASHGGDPRDTLALVDDAITEVPELRREPTLQPASHWEEDETYPVEDWRREVVDDDTRLGYLEWVTHQREIHVPRASMQP